MRKSGYFLMVMFFVYLLLEVGLRTVLSISTGASFVRPSNLIYKYYPELIPIQNADISNTDSTFDVLILSCSVLHKDWVDIVAEMNKCMHIPSGYRNIKIYNASGVGHGSRDNLIKSNLLRNKKFDVVMYYDAINDSRLNNCPVGVFKSDYSHYRWYDEINHIVGHPEMNYTVIPFMVDWARIHLKALVNDAYVPQHFSLRPDWLAFGSDMKSLPCYNSNLAQVMEIARGQNERFVYFTFAYYVQPEYSLEKFRARKLDYTFCDHSRETEIWGRAENVSRFIDSVNYNSKVWVGKYPNTKWVDLYSSFPRSGGYFADICHFSPKGIHEFAAIVCNQLDSLSDPDVK